MTITLSRQQVLAHRMAVQGLHRQATDPADLSVLDLGVQDTPAGTAVQAIGARLVDAGVAATALERADLAVTWTLRGAPHVVRNDDLVRLSRALWPVSEADALERLDASAMLDLAGLDLGARPALRMVAERFAAAIDGPTPKGQVSTQVSDGLEPGLLVDCPRCRAIHVADVLFRAAALPAGAVVANPGQRSLSFRLVPDWPGPPDAAVDTNTLLATGLHLLGPATPADIVALLDTRASHLADAWPNGLVEVTVEGRPAWVAEVDLAAVQSPPPPPRVRLIPPSDPFLQARDRDILVPDRERRAALFPSLGRPGALLVDGEIAGTWRARKAGRRRLDVTVTPFEPIGSSAAGLEGEAVRIAASRGLPEATVGLEE